MIENDCDNWDSDPYMDILKITDLACTYMY